MNNSLNEGQLEAEVTPDMEERIIKDLLDLEIELLQGDRTVLPSGMIKIKLQINDPLKKEAVKEFLLLLIAGDVHSDASKN